ncbi:MAG: ribbon-helix-helix domain-containing protein [Chloroflexota bacterium]|nr:ribbon-helix-helix domain-containing protein [Chloroflexota bacterium]
MTNKPIIRNTKTITFSLPPEMAEQVQDVMRDEGRTMSELIREALRNYMEEREWLRTIRYEKLRARHAEQEDSQGE